MGFHRPSPSVCNDRIGECGQVTQWGVPRIYRSQLASRLPYSCRQGICDAAVMTDVAP